jgi:hypothetical protein
MFKVIKPNTTVSFWDRVGPNPEIKNAARSFNHTDNLWLSEKTNGNC